MIKEDENRILGYNVSEPIVWISTEPYVELTNSSPYTNIHMLNPKDCRLLARNLENLAKKIESAKATFENKERAKVFNLLKKACLDVGFQLYRRDDGLIDDNLVGFYIDNNISPENAIFKIMSTLMYKNKDDMETVVSYLNSHKDSENLDKFFVVYAPEKDGRSFIEIPALYYFD